MSAGTMHSDPLSILLVEDNWDHAELVMRCLEERGLAAITRHVADGVAALDYLFHRGRYADPLANPRPHLVLLDLRLPKLDGLEVLGQIKQSEELRKIPVVILTTSGAEHDVSGAYDRYANSYLVKPVRPAELSQLIDGIVYYWMGWNHCPWCWRPHHPQG